MSSGAGELFVLAQKVVIEGAGEIATLAQDVALHTTGGGEIAVLSQSVDNSGAGELFTLSQQVVEPEHQYHFVQGDVASLFGSEKFDITIIVGGVIIDNTTIHGDITITRAEDQSALCDFTLLPGTGVQSISQYHGKAVVIKATTETRTVTIYQGVVDVPNIDLINKFITLNCTDSRKEKANALSDSFINGIGYYSENVFSDVDTQLERLEQRLQTVPASYDYDAVGIGRLTDWKPKAVPDYQLSDATIFYRNPSVQVLSRGRVTNKVTIELEFQYQRLRHREIEYDFDAELTACYYSAWGLPPKKTQMLQAIESAGWPYTDFTITKNIDPSGGYNCFGHKEYWSTKKSSVTLTAQVDDKGKEITDAAGRTQYDTSNRTVTDITGSYAQECNWKASKRWAQNVVETMTIIVQAPQSIEQYGEVESEKSYGVVAEYDATGWETYESYQSPPSGFSVSANGDYVYNQDALGLQAWQSAALTALHIARTEIIKAHRDNTVSFEVPFWPDVGLHHTVETTGGTVRAKGKVTRIVHNLNIEDRDCSTDIELSLSQSIGTATDSGTPVPTRPAVGDSTQSVVRSIKLRSVTVDIGAEQDPTSTGYIFKQLVRAGKSVPAGLKKPIALIIDTPDVDDASRDTKEVEGAQDYTVEIRNDLLEVEF